MQDQADDANQQKKQAIDDTASAQAGMDIARTTRQHFSQPMGVSSERDFLNVLGVVRHNDAALCPTNFDNQLT